MCAYPPCQQRVTRTPPTNLLCHTPRRPFAEKYAEDAAAFFADYAAAHAKLSELGVKWAEGAPVTL